MFSPEIIRTLLDKLNQIQYGLAGLLPELGLLVLIVVLLLLDLLAPRGSFRQWCVVSMLGLGVVLYLVYLQHILLHETKRWYGFGGAWQLTPFGWHSQMLMIVGTMLAGLVMYFAPPLPTHHRYKAEYWVLLLANLWGLLLMAKAANWLGLYLSLEVVSLSAYLLVALPVTRISGVAAIKYLLFGAFASGIMLYGISWLYGLGGTLQFSANSLERGIAHAPAPLVVLAVFFAFGGLLFKLTIAPLHWWTPEVYAGTPNSLLAYLSTVPKIGAVLMLYTLSSALMQYETLAPLLRDLLAGLAILSIGIGNFAALRQSSLKRMLAYSGIAHAGFLLGGVLLANEMGAAVLRPYLVVYLVMNIAAFWLADLGARYVSPAEDDQFKHYTGLGKYAPVLGLMWLVVLLGLVGLPPTVGFFIKFRLFLGWWEEYTSTGAYSILFLLVWASLNTALSLFYYLRIPYLMFVKPSDTPLAPPTALVSIAEQTLAGIVVLAMVLLFFLPQWVL